MTSEKAEKENELSRESDFSPFIHTHTYWQISESEREGEPLSGSLSRVRGVPSFQGEILRWKGREIETLSTSLNLATFPSCPLSQEVRYSLLSSLDYDSPFLLF